MSGISSGVKRVLFCAPRLEVNTLGQSDAFWNVINSSAVATLDLSAANSSRNIWVEIRMGIGSATAKAQHCDGIVCELSVLRRFALKRQLFQPSPPFFLLCNRFKLQFYRLQSQKLRHALFHPNPADITNQNHHDIVAISSIKPASYKKVKEFV
ncbi:MAG: hypothetical protein H6844_15130 [Alphaproteobacteria bacterium]|nr:hypothetical protein [Alphaproteobacteria bacterium]